MVQAMREIGLKANSMDREFTHGLMALHTMEATNTVSKTALENTFILLKTFTKASGLKEFDMDVVPFLIKEEISSRKAFGIQINF
jgi:hypothetical protein